MVFSILFDLFVLVLDVLPQFLEYLQFFKSDLPKNQHYYIIIPTYSLVDRFEKRFAAHIKASFKEENCSHDSNGIC
jgi:hypothetical protein